MGASGRGKHLQARQEGDGHLCEPWQLKVRLHWLQRWLQDCKTALSVLLSRHHCTEQEEEVGKKDTRRRVWFLAGGLRNNQRSEVPAGLMGASYAQYLLPATRQGVRHSLARYQWHHLQKMQPGVTASKDLDANREGPTQGVNCMVYPHLGKLRCREKSMLGIWQIL